MCAVFSLTKEAKKSGGGGGVGVGSKGPEWLPGFEELQSASVLFANDLWTGEDEWEGSPWDI